MLGCETLVGMGGAMLTSGNLTVIGRTCFPSPSSTVISVVRCVTLQLEG